MPSISDMITDSTSARISKETFDKNTIAVPICIPTTAEVLLTDTSAIDSVLSQGSYQRLAQIVALTTRPLIVAIGSGLSSPKIKGWGDLFSTLKAELEQQTFSNDEAFARLSPHLTALDAAGEDPWARFDIISKAIPTEYRNIIYSEVGKSQSGPIPEIHEQIWKLPISGVISLNIDTYARRAGTKHAAGKEFKIEHGMNAGRVQRILLSPHLFLYELHGKLDDEATWVFGKSQLNRLYKQAGYRQFLDTVFTQFSVIFIGISADDVAIGSPLRQMAGKGIAGPDHYWITSRIDDEAVEWAETAHVERVIYPAGENNVVLELLKRLSRVQGAESEAEPVWTDTAGTAGKIPPVEALGQQSTSEIRTSLNRHAGWLLGHDKRDLYEAFVRSYDELIDRAWYMPPDPHGYKLFDYTVIGPPLRGAFGAVYQVQSNDGEILALKLLRREIRDNLPLLHSFRRGVEAMRILADREVSGMVAHRDASEIPTFVTMDWINGPNLATAKQAHMLNEWPDILNVAVQVCRTVLTAHQLPEQVLHRDIRPANIMLKDGWEPTNPLEVVVLDFDLATYRGAVSESILAEGSALGYLAPEQLVQQKGATSRSALVDAFGIGMTLYYLAGGNDPDAYMQRSTGFGESVKVAVSKPDGQTYTATSRRVQRLIENATRDTQQDRWSLPLMKHELQRLLDANVGTGHALDSDLIAEEIVCRCAYLADRYTWNPDDTATYEIASGPSVSVHAYASDLRVTAQLEWLDSGTNDRKSLYKYLPEKMEKAKALLTSKGWDLEKSVSGSKTLRLHASCPVTTDTDCVKLGSALNDAIDALIFT